MLFQKSTLHMKFYPDYWILLCMCTTKKILKLPVHHVCPSTSTTVQTTMLTFFKFGMVGLHEILSEYLKFSLIWFLLLILGKDYFAEGTE